MNRIRRPKKPIDASESPSAFSLKNIFVKREREKSFNESRHESYPSISRKLGLCVVKIKKIEIGFEPRFTALTNTLLCRTKKKWKYICKVRYIK